jgi:uncharacterized protein YijF (DUF1287 family)
MKVGDMVKWKSDGNAPVPGIVIDTFIEYGTPYAIVFWIDLGVQNAHPHEDLITISEA